MIRLALVIPKLKLWHQGLALVVLILCVELAIAGQLWTMLKAAEAQADKEALAEAIIAKAHALGSACYESGKSIGIYLTFKLPDAGKKFEKENARVFREFSELEDLLRTSPGAIEALKPLKDSLVACQDELMLSKHAVDSGERWTDRRFRQDVLPKITDFAQQLQRLIDDDQEVAKEQARQQQAKVRGDMERLLQLATIANVIFAIALISFLMRNIVRGLNRLADNSFRLAHGQMLHPPMKGADEISQLDRAFHDMARALKDASEKERAALDRTQSMIEHMPVGLITVAEDGTIKAINPRTERMFGFSPQDLHGKHLSVLFAPSSATSEETFIQELKSKAFNKITEYKARRNDGSLFPAELSLDQFATDQGEAFLANILDISERYEVERMKREFVAMVSHDLRTPLTSVEASLTLLSAGALGDLSSDAKRTVSMAEQEVVRLRNLVNDLLDIAKIESGKMDMKMSDVDLKDLIGRSVSSIEAYADKQDVAVETGGTDGTAYGDRDRLVQVMVNLLSNAVKYTPPGGTVLVSAEQIGNWQEIRVRDEGPGVPEEFQEIIFHKFEQMKGGQQKHGTGLGLAICRTIIEQHGGVIGVDSENGKGSTFWFRVPNALSTVLPSASTEAAPRKHS